VASQMNECIENDCRPRPREGEVGVYVDELGDGQILEIVTRRHKYLVVKQAGSEVLMLGHPMFCPEPVLVQILGSFATWPDASPEPGFIGCGMYLMFKHPVFDQVTTSRVMEIHRM
jgi:hypothetical protein